MAAALRAGLGDSLLSGLDFRVGGGVMYYNRQRPALPADLAGLSPSKLGLPDNEAAQVCVALVLLAGLLASAGAKNCYQTESKGDAVARAGMERAALRR